MSDLISRSALIKKLEERIRTPRSTMEIKRDIIPMVESQPTPEVKPVFLVNTSDTTSVFRCECLYKFKVHHSIGTLDNNDAPNYCQSCGVKFDWSDE